MKKQVTLPPLSIIFSVTGHRTQNEGLDLMVIIADDMGNSEIPPSGGGPLYQSPSPREPHEPRMRPSAGKKKQKKNKI